MWVKGRDRGPGTEPGLWLNYGGKGKSGGNSMSLHLDYLVPQIGGRRHPVESLDCG